MDMEMAQLIAKAISDGFDDISLVIIIIGLLFLLFKPMGN